MRRLAHALAAAGALLACAAAPAPAAVPFAPCPDAGFGAFECARVAQPLDRSGGTAGSVSLFVRRLRAQTPAQTPTAVVALAGGPGQAATPAAGSFAVALAPALRGRDLLVFDQRGTGASDPLSCPALARGGSAAEVVGACAAELGPRRGFHRTRDSVADLEALRAQAGYERLTLYGVSYGTKLALDYAAAHPDRVERLVLDSVVAPEGPDALQRSSFRAVPRILRELCGAGRCRSATPDPVADIRTLVRRGRVLRGTYVTSRGRRRTARVEPQTLYAILRIGDLNPAWRALYPGAIRAAVRGDAAPVVRLALATLGSPGGSQSEQGDGSQAVFLSTLCEEGAFPWDRAAAPPARAEQAEAAFLREPVETFRPFDRETAAATTAAGPCIGWPNATPAPDAPAPLPPVPTLVLAGAGDVRTPAEDAQAVAARLGGAATVVVVPHVGHSVLGTDPSGCARAAIAGFFVSGQVTACPPTAPALRPVARPARRLGELPRTGGLPGRVGRTVTAVLRTRDDALMSAAGEALGGGRRRLGGLRGGTITQTERTVTLRRVVVVPGVTVSGRFPAEGDARLTVRGPSAARGSLRFTRSGRLVGRLGGRRIRLRSRARAGAATHRAVPLPDLARAAG